MMIVINNLYIATIFSSIMQQRSQLLLPVCGVSMRVDVELLQLPVGCPFTIERHRTKASHETNAGNLKV